MSLSLEGYRIRILLTGYMVGILLDAGADRRMRNASGETALKLAHAAGHPQVEQLIESRKSGWPSWFGSHESASRR